MSILRHWIKKEDPKPEKREKGVELNLKYPLFVWEHNKDKPSYVSKLAVRHFPRYYVTLDVVFVEVGVDMCVMLPIKETEEELLKLFGRDKK